MRLPNTHLPTLKGRKVLDKLGPAFIYLVSAIDFYDRIAPILGGTPASVWDLILLTLGILGVGVASLWIGLGWSFWRGAKTSILEGKELPQQQNLRLFTRKEIEPSFEKFLQEANHEVVIIGVSVVLSIRGKEDIFQRLLEQKRLNLEFLFLDPESKLIERLESDLDWKGMRGDIKTAISSLEGLRKKLSTEIKGKLKIAVYDRIPIVSTIILDPESQKPTIQVVNYVSGTDIGSRFAIQIRGMDRTESIPQKYLEEYQRFVDSSKVYEEKEGAQSS